MRPRILLGRALIRLGGFVQSLALPVMRPRDLIELSRLHYARPEVISSRAADSNVDGGLGPTEAAMLDRVPLRQGRLLDLGAGGGREAIAFARMGCEVTCIDFLPDLTEKTRASAARGGFDVLDLRLAEEPWCGWAILKKSLR